MEEKWTVFAKKADFDAIAKRFDIDPVTARLLRNRDLQTEEEIERYLHGTLADLYAPERLQDLSTAVEILKEKIAVGKKIRVIGDYDADGVMAAYILVRGLRNLGASCDYRIPHRIHDGYGMNETLVREAAHDAVDTILTCDNGISAVREVALARELGMTVIVTDHHVVSELPAADAVIDPQREDCSYPCKAICGATVAWKLVLALGGDPRMQLLPYAAFATVTDVVDLIDENRILVREGLAKLRVSDNPGICALAAACGIELPKLTTRQIGFVLGPCINASGRLDSADRALGMLLAEEEAEAAKVAQELKALNDSRRAMTDEAVEQAMQMVEEKGLDKQKIIVLLMEELHASLPGLVAGRIRETYEHPCFVLTRGEEGYVGSGRSIAAYHMAHALQGVSKLLTKFGGHPMAAGLSMPAENLSVFIEEINAQCTLTEEDFKRQVQIDCAMPLSYVTDRIATEVELLEPCGKGNPGALFADRCVLVEEMRFMGRDNSFLLLKARSLDENGRPNGAQQVIKCFYDAAALHARLQENPKLQIAYGLSRNDYYTPARTELVLRHWR